MRALRRATSKLNKVEDISDQIEWVEGDVLDIPSLEEAMKDITEVYHCAAIVSFNPSSRQPCMKSTSKVLLTLLMSL